MSTKRKKTKRNSGRRRAAKGKERSLQATRELVQPVCSLGEHAVLKNAVQEIQVASENLCSSVFELGCDMVDHELALTEEKRSELEQRDAENHEIAGQHDSSDNHLSSIHRSIKGMHRRLFEMTKLHTHVWM